MNKQKELDKNENQSTSPGPKSRINVIVPLAIIGLVVIVVVGFFTFQGQQKAPPQITSESQNRRYKNGTYNAVGDYTSPGGAEHIGVTVTLKDDIIVDSDVSTEMAKRPNTIKFQGIFKENYKQFVIGKNIDEVRLDKVSASSLTPKGFNDGLEKIKAEAKV